MPSKLNKVQKHVTKKKGDKINSLHENSRDALRLRKAGARDERVLRVNAVREQANQPWLQRILYFQERLPETLHPLEVGQIQELIKDFLSRQNFELEQMKADRRPGRPPSNRQSLLEQQQQAESLEFESGFWLPNLQDEETLEKLDAWKGDWLSLGAMRFSRISQAGIAKESQFPPRGAS